MDKHTLELESLRARLRLAEGQRDTLASAVRILRADISCAMSESSEDMVRRRLDMGLVTARQALASVKDWIPAETDCHDCGDSTDGKKVTTDGLFLCDTCAE